MARFAQAKTRVTPRNPLSIEALLRVRTGIIGVIFYVILASAKC